MRGAYVDIAYIFYKICKTILASVGSVTIAAIVSLKADLSYKIQNCEVYSMKAHLVSKDNKVSLDEKLKTLETYSTGDLLYVLREFEDCPRRFEDDVIKKLASLLYAKGIICM